jgi:Arc/MetJ-type ribon-helix-helix transcriptional regulator
MLSMVNGMATTTKLTITLDDAQFTELKKLVAAGQADSVSGFVRQAVEVALNDAAGWSEMLSRALEQSGGPLTAAERAWADEILGHKRQTPKKRRRS